MPRSSSEFVGEIVAHHSGLNFDVRLDDGRSIAASVPTHTARLMVRIVAGDRVRVVFRDPPKTPRIVGFAKSD